MTMTTADGRSGMPGMKSNMDDHENLSTNSADLGKSGHIDMKVKNYLELNVSRDSKNSGSKMGHHRAVNINYNIAIDLDRLEKFKGVIKEFAKTKKLARVIGLIFTKI